MQLFKLLTLFLILEIIQVNCLPYEDLVDYAVRMGHIKRDKMGTIDMNNPTKRTDLCPPPGSDWQVYNAIAKQQLFNVFLNHAFVEGTLKDLNLTLATLSDDIIYYIMPAWEGGHGKTEMINYYVNFAFPDISNSNDLNRWQVGIKSLAFDVSSFNCSTGLVSGIFNAVLYGRGNLTYVPGSSSNGMNSFLPGLVLKGDPVSDEKLIRNPILNFLYTVETQIINNLISREIVLWNTKDFIEQLKVKRPECYYNKYFTQPGYNLDQTLGRFVDINAPGPAFRTGVPTVFRLSDCDD